MNKEDYLEELKALEGKIDIQREALDDLGPLPEWAILYSLDIVNPGGFRIDIPADKKKLSETRRIAGRSWRFDRKVTSTVDGHSWYVYLHRTLGVELKIDLNPKLAGSTYHLVQVGERVEPIYEVRCDDEA